MIELFNESKIYEIMNEKYKTDALYKGGYQARSPIERHLEQLRLEKAEASGNKILRGLERLGIKRG